MSNLPIRDVGNVGVITDISPENLPLNAFSRAKNVRFDENKVTRSPVFRNIKDSLGFYPRFTYGVPATSPGNFDAIILVTDTYDLWEYSNGVVADRSGTIATTSAQDSRFTGTNLADITYINRVDAVPSYMVNGGSGFAVLPNWDATWRCVAMRSYGDFLIALNMTENGVDYPSRVRYSDLTLANSVPDSWDETDTTKSAGFNDLVQLKTPIVDGQTLGTNFIIYAKDSVWLMEFVGGAFIHNFRKLFDDTGVINHNCVVEVEGVHYVFADNDIYRHDTHTRQSICDERVKDYIFGGLNTAQVSACFVQHNPDLDEVYFCYRSGDDMATYTQSDRCNRAAVYNYKSNTWSFMDLPNVSASTLGTIGSSDTYANTVFTYDLIGGNYYTQEGGFDVHTLFTAEQSTADGITSSKLLGLDLSDRGTLSFPLDVECNKSPWLQRTAIDLDEVSPLVGYKVITRLVPQVSTASGNKDFDFTFGAANLLQDVPSNEPSVTFDATTEYKIDSRAAGRYLSYSMTVTDYKDFAFGGFDADITVTGRR